MNETTGQNLVVTKKQFGEHYVALLFAGMKDDGEEGQKVSPEFSTSVKADAFAMGWMTSHPNGQNSVP